MSGKESPIDALGIGHILLELKQKKAMPIRKIASHLEEEGYRYNGRSISKSAIHRWLQKHEDEGAPPPIVVEGALDVEHETITLFNSCKKIFNSQLNAINEAIKNGDKLDLKSLYALLSTARTLIGQLDMYMKKVHGVATGASLQIYINQYNALTVNVIEHVAAKVIEDEPTRTRFIDELAKTFYEPPKEFLPSAESV